MPSDTSSRATPSVAGPDPLNHAGHPADPSHHHTEHEPRDPGARAGRVLRFDRVFTRIGVARLQRSSGTRDPEKFQILNNLLTTLAATSDGAVIVRMFAAERISVEELDLAGTPAGLRILTERCATLEAAAAAAHESGPAEADDAAPRASSPGAHLEIRVNEPKAEDRDDVLRHVLGPRPSGISLIERPLWATGRELIAQMAVEPATARRYQTSVDALRRKTRTLAITEETRNQIAGISPAEWAMLRLLQSRKITIPELMDLVCWPPEGQAQWLRKRRIRLSPAPLLRVSQLSRDEWEALRSVDSDGVSVSVIANMEGLTPEERGEASAIGALFGPDATFAALVQMTNKQWRLLSRVWGTSAADWNHVRRVVSALLTTLFGTETHPARVHVVDRIPLRPEPERVPNLTPKMLLLILSHLPKHARAFPMCLAVTGLRVGEYEALEPEHLHHETCVIDVPGTKTADSCESISVAPDMWHYVANAVPSPCRYGAMRQLFRDACDAAGVGHFTLHDLRHCHGQWALEGGAHEHEVQAQLRHKSIAMTRRYTRTLQKRRAAEAAHRHMQASLEQP